MTRRLGLWSLLLLLLVWAVDASARRVPKPRGVVVDQSGILTPADLKSLRNGIEALQLQYNSKLAVLVIPSLHDDILDKYAKRVARRWQFDESLDGALLVVSLRERELYIESFGKLRRAVNTRTLGAIDALVFRPGSDSNLGIGVSAWLDVFDGLCAEAFIPEIRLGRKEPSLEPETAWRRWLDVPITFLALIWLVLRLKRVRMGEFRHENADLGWTSIERESTFGGGKSRHGSFGGGGGSASWGRSR
ncbi:MAG: TPM domain-containing protein [Myxococcota bacterium]|nr:TPM domain-containing protein [Myxococcota bacterium]